MNSSLKKLLSSVELSQFGKTVIDVGAYRGDFSRMMADFEWFDRVVAFEANPENIKILRSNLSGLKNCDITIIEAALGNQFGYQAFYSYEDLSTSSLLPAIDMPHVMGISKEKKVLVTTLDEYFHVNSFGEKVGLIKVDTQGNDLNVIRGAVNTINRCRPILQVEFIYIPMYSGQATPSDLLEALINLGYLMYSLNNIHVTRQGRLAFCDALFVPSEMNIECSYEFTCIDNEESFESQIKSLHKVCELRLQAINVLDAEVRRLQKIINR